MNRDGSAPNRSPDTSVQTLQREKEALSQQVKRLIRAEGRLYEYQEELDAQLKEYKELYEFNRRLNRIVHIEDILRETVAYVVEHLDYERAVCFRRDEASRSYRICALDGYYDAADKESAAAYTLPEDAPCLALLFAGSDYLVCRTDPAERITCQTESAAVIAGHGGLPDSDPGELGVRLLMREYLVYPLGSRALPQALLAVGNSSANASFYRKIDDRRASLLSLGNLAGVVSWLIENRESEQKYRQLSEDLERRVKEAVDELRQKDKILILQGRQAVMGEMISNIAHQWRQPLNTLALQVQELLLIRKQGELSEEELESTVRKSLEIINQMSKTIDYFRFFFKPDKEKVEFRVLESIENSLSILDGSLRMHQIETELSPVGDPVVNGYQTEFVQVLLNILINARDALAVRKPAAPLIAIRLFNEKGRTVVTIADNGGGIPEEIIDRVFDPYFTTKGPEQGTGIGLFMSKTIIEKNMGGRLGVRNVGDGAEFRIEV